MVVENVFFSQQLIHSLGLGVYWPFISCFLLLSLFLFCFSFVGCAGITLATSRTTGGDIGSLFTVGFLPTTALHSISSSSKALLTGASSFSIMSFSNRHSIYSTTSASPYAANTQQAGGQVTTSNLLSALHNSYQSGTPHTLDASTTLVVNSGNGLGNAGYGGGVIDENVGTRAWEHARRRAEDQTILLV